MAWSVVCVTNREATSSAMSRPVIARGASVIASRDPSSPYLEDFPAAGHIHFVHILELLHHRLLFRTLTHVLLRFLVRCKTLMSLGDDDAVELPRHVRHHGRVPVLPDVRPLLHELRELAGVPGLADEDVVHA